MSDFRDPYDPFAFHTEGAPSPPDAKAGWAWIAAAVFLVVVLAVAFGAGHRPEHVAANDTPPLASPAAPPTLTAPKANDPARPTAPGLMPAPALSPAPAPGPSRP